MNASKLGITNNGTYYDAIIFDSWKDNSAGNTNALLFSKNSTTLYHIQAPFKSTTSWGTPIKIWDANNLTKVSQLTNDAGYLTSHQDISGKVSRSGDTISGIITFNNLINNDKAINLDYN